MPLIQNGFNGKMNYDVDPFRIDNGDYIDALNITKDAQGVSQDRVVSNIKGNVNVPYTLPSGQNKIIGSYPDKVRNRQYYFSWNSNGFHSIFYYNALTDSIVKLLQSKTDSNGIDILNFNPSFKIFSINIFYRDEGDIIFFNDGYNPPRNISTGANYGTAWKAEYLDGAKPPPVMPIRCTYENDTNVTVNNLRNSLFQFRYRFVYANNEKSVWSTCSIIPLPNQPSITLTSDIFTNNARISVSMSTGSIEVKKIELAFRQEKNGVTSDWFLISSLVKSNLSIPDNDIYTYRFYNDGLYPAIDPLDTIQLQDLFPQLADAGELLNGNTPIYGSITEGYDTFNPTFSITENANATPFFIDYNGLLFFSTINGIESGSTGTVMKVYLYGTGINTSGNVTTLNNAFANFVINAVDGSNNSIGINVANGSDTAVVSTLLGSISTALVANGWTQTSLSGNILTMNFAGGATILSSGIIYNSSTQNDTTTLLAYANQDAMSFGIAYYDSKGRTNGVITNTSGNISIPSLTINKYPQQRVTISHRPPSWAYYYDIVRTIDLTYGKRLFWISKAAYSDISSADPKSQFAYLNIDNIQYYNEQILSTSGVVSYNFQPGDRIKFISRYNSSGIQTNTLSFDYEILGTVVNPVVNGLAQLGNFIKIYYPSADVSSNMRFDGTSDYQNYQILLYNYTQHATGSNNVYFEFGKRFAIGNPGTSNAYHIGLNQTQTSNLTTPAIIDIVNGIYFFRNRSVPVGNTLTLTATAINNGFVYVSVGLSIATALNASNYTVQSSNQQQANSLTPGDYTPANSFFLSNTVNGIKVRIRGTIPITVDGGTSTSVYFQAVNSDQTFQLISVVQPIAMISGQTYNISFDSTIIVQGNAHLHLIIQNSAQVSNQRIYPFFITVDVINNITIPVVESSFSDVYNLTINSNGRPTVIDENAKRTKFPTLVRFGGTYQANTNINGTNRFKEDNFDEYDRGFGAIRRLHVRDRYLKVYQQFKVGNVPVLTQIVQDTSGNPLQAQSDRLINKIQYYQGDYGIADSPSSLAWNNFADYFVDDYRGVVCRLSQDGIEPISILYQMNAFFVDKLKWFRKDLNNGIAASGQVYSGDATVYGAFDAFTNKYIVALEEINRYSDPNTLIFHQDGFTLSFDENMNSFESFYSYKPEWISCLNTLVISFKNGQLWRHNSNIFCNFYGIQYDAYITTVFNAIPMEKKTFISITETANTIWSCPIINTNMFTFGTTKQSSVLINKNFILLETEYCASFLRDINSQGGLINGISLKGNYIIIRFQITSASNFSYINIAGIKYITSQLNSH